MEGERAHCHGSFSLSFLINVTAQPHQTWRHVCIAMRTSTRPCMRTQQPWQIRVCVGGGVLTNFHLERDCRWKRNSSGSPFLPTWKERAGEIKMTYYEARVTIYKKAYKGKVTVHCNLFAVARSVASNKEAEEWKATAVTHRDISEETP